MEEKQESVVADRVKYTKEMTDYLKSLKGTELSFREICVQFSLKFPDANVDPSKLRGKLNRMGIKPFASKGGVHLEIQVSGVIKTGLFKKHKIVKVYKCENEVQAEEMFHNDLTLNEFPDKSFKIKKIEFAKMIVND